MRNQIWLMLYPTIIIFMFSVVIVTPTDGVTNIELSGDTVKINGLLTESQRLAPYLEYWRFTYEKGDGEIVKISLDPHFSVISVTDGVDREKITDSYFFGLIIIDRGEVFIFGEDVENVYIEYKMKTNEFSFYNLFL